MQQLVKLMKDLVDFQVQQKTCAKLPPDLADFLKWLTSPSNSDDSNYNQFNTVQDEFITSNDNYLKSPDIAPNFNILAANEIKEDPRSECLATLHAVQDLLNQYEDLSDEDKMPTFYGKRSVSVRDKRNLTQKKDRNKTRAQNRQMLSKNRITKFVRKSGIKHTKTTASSIEAINTSEGVRRKKNISNDAVNTTDVKASVLNHGAKSSSKSNKPQSRT
ncbi:unnamed protein product [Parnassius apollo]|uniref:(apollo) hypothetical protein n=1 Tax=Parnassius apollo TaxID=110799 RepID=A0A8S3XCF4_PARAO|nr:unnamed protein product [Parnassius apollo]